MSRPPKFDLFRWTLALAALTALTSVQATTLEQLSLASMTRQSTAIVRARVIGSANVVRGGSAYTQYRLELAEVWKAAGRAPVEVAVPGGVVKGLRQVVSGAPVLEAGREYVLFLWTSPRGVTQIMGLSQGLFFVDGQAVVRAATNERMLDAAGQPVRDTALRFQVPELKAQVMLAGGGLAGGGRK